MRCPRARGGRAPAVGPACPRAPLPPAPPSPRPAGAPAATSRKHLTAQLPPPGLLAPHLCLGSGHAPGHPTGRVRGCGCPPRASQEAPLCPSPDHALGQLKRMLRTAASRLFLLSLLPSPARRSRVRKQEVEPGRPSGPPAPAPDSLPPGPLSVPARAAPTSRPRAACPARGVTRGSPTQAEGAAGGPLGGLMPQTLDPDGRYGSAFCSMASPAGPL